MYTNERTGIHTADEVAGCQGHGCLSPASPGAISTSPHGSGRGDAQVALTDQQMKTEYRNYLKNPDAYQGLTKQTADNSFLQGLLGTAKAATASVTPAVNPTKAKPLYNVGDSVPSANQPAAAQTFTPSPETKTVNTLPSTVNKNNTKNEHPFLAGLGISPASAGASTYAPPASPNIGGEPTDQAAVAAEPEKLRKEWDALMMKPGVTRQEFIDAFNKKTKLKSLTDAVKLLRISLRQLIR